MRELRNVIERACLLSQGDIASTSTTRFTEEPRPALGIRTDLPFKEAKGQLVEMFEREYIEDLMRRHKMNLSAAAREAQIDRKHLRELIRKYDLDPAGQERRRRLAGGSPKANAQLLAARSRKRPSSTHGPCSTDDGRFS